MKTDLKEIAYWIMILMAIILVIMMLTGVK